MTATAPEQIEKPKVKCDSGAGTPLAEATDLSKNTPPKDTKACTATDLPAVTLTDNTGKPVLTDDAVKTAAQDINTALHPGIFGSKNFDQIKNTITSMNASDMARLEKAYDKPGQPAGLLRQELHDRLPADQFRQIEALLDRKDGKPNLAGNVAVAIETANNGGIQNAETAGRMLRSTMETLTSDQIVQLKKDWDAKYGSQYGTFDKAILAAKFNNSDKLLVAGEYNDKGEQIKPGFFSTGVKERTPEQIAAAAKLVVDYYNQNESDSSKADQYLRQLSDVLGGEGPAAAARKALQGDKDFMASYDKAFGPSTWANETQRMVAKDLLTEGRISLATIVTGNTKTLAGLGFYDNPENVTSALTHATPQERANFIAGKHLLESKRDPSTLNPAEKDQLAYYQISWWRASGDCLDRAVGEWR